MRIAFFSSNILPIHAKSLDERPVGGIETGIIRLSESLVARGHDVFVFTPNDTPPLSNNPHYLPRPQIEQIGEVDLYITVRDWIPLLYRVKAKKRFFWTGDSYDQFPNFGMGDARVVAAADRVLAVSHWHADTLSKASGFPREKFFVLRNGVHLPLFKEKEDRRRKRLIYSSMPYRGLEYVPAYFSEVKKAHPDAEIHVFSGYQVYDQKETTFQALREKLTALPGCTLHGNILQKDLAREFLKSSVLFYPCHFEETSCITAIEAQAAGCPVVTTDLAALSETVGDAGFLIPGLPSEASYQKAFVEATNRLLSDDALWQKLSARGQERAEQLSWAKAAERLEALFKSLI